ncbi:CCR4-NOT transcription complex subunit 2-like [Brevipalpus obovatus]|uniref:CCR4-NOT transcription complex subunit 2-like n=1 Tax=Brevipalpus obovatus TaxID=246614 RepID=UPI003D9E9222
MDQSRQGFGDSNSASSKRLQQTQAQVDEVVGIMRTNVEKVLERDQKLNELDDRAEALQQGASQFEQQAIKLKRKEWWRNMKMMAILAAVVIILLIVIIASFSGSTSNSNNSSNNNNNVQSHGGHENLKRNQSNTGLGGILGSNSIMNNSNQQVSGPSGSSATMSSPNSESPSISGLTSSKNMKRGIQTSKDGRVSNIPPGMVTDQFGMVGLLTFIRAAESDPNLVSLALGIDLATLKLDLNSTDNLYSTFSGPWSDQSLKPHEMDYPVPHEYLINSQIREKLLPIKLNRYGDDTLFFLFYMFPNDLIQLAAATELYTRDWRYHKDEKVWITRAPGMPPIEKCSNYERGTYYFFDAHNWRRVAKEFLLDYNRLEQKPMAPPYPHITNSLVGQQTPPTGSLVSL